MMMTLIVLTENVITFFKLVENERTIKHLLTAPVQASRYFSAFVLSFLNKAVSINCWSLESFACFHSAM